MTAWNRRDFLQKTGWGAAGLTLGSGLLSLTLQAEEPHVAAASLNKLSDQDEIQLGRRFAVELDKSVAILSNPFSDYYLNSLVGDLASRSQRPNLPYSIKLINSHAADAFALPGGFLYVHRGLIELVNSEDEFAAAISHEIGHVAARHTVNQMLLSFDAQHALRTVLDNLYVENEVVDKTIVKLGGGVDFIDKLRYSRKDDLQADLLGFYQLLRAGWDPNAFIRLFAKLEELGKSTIGMQIPYLLTHPTAAERTAAIRHELTVTSVSDKARSNSVKFQFLKTALTLVSEPPK